MKARILILVFLPFLVCGVSSRYEPHRRPSGISTYRHHRPNDAYRPLNYNNYRRESYAGRYQTHQYNRGPDHGGHKKYPYSRYRMEKMKRPRKDDSKPRRPKKQMTESKSKPVRRPAMNKRPQKPPAPIVKERIPKKPSKNDRPMMSRPKSPEKPPKEVQRRKCRRHRHGEFTLSHDHDEENCHSSHNFHMVEKSKCAKSINYKGKYLVSNLDDQACPLMTYTQANDFCTMQNLRAVTISSELEDEKIDEIFGIANITGDFWTGGFIENPSRRKVTWGDELDDILPALWAPGQPDGPKNRRVRVSEIEFCIAVRQVEGLSEMDPPGLLHDEPCHRLAAAVCEEKPSSMKLGFMDPETEQTTDEMEEQVQLKREEEQMPFESMDPETEEMEELLQLDNGGGELMFTETETMDDNQPNQPMAPLTRQPFSSPRSPSRPPFHIPTFRPQFPTHMPKRPFIPMHHDMEFLQRRFANKYSEPDLTNLCEHIVKSFIANEAAPPIRMPMERANSDFEEANIDFEENN